MQTKSQIEELLTAAGVSPNRKLGQHFLVDLNLMRLVVEAAGIGREDVVLEVGAGTGSLTEALARQAGQVVAVELDPTLAGIARSQLAGAANVVILNTDVLSNKGTVNPAVTEAVTQAQARLREKGPQEPEGADGTGWQPQGRRPWGWLASDSEQVSTRGADHPQAALEAATHSETPSKGRLLLVSNLPYDVASAVTINLVRGPVTADAMVVTVQREVAERMTAHPGRREYGTLSIFLQATGTVELLRRLKPSVFWPPPGVDSAVVRYVRDPAKSRRVVDMDFFAAVVSLFIGHRRKMLRACLKQTPPELDGRDLWLKIFEQLAIDPTRRPEELSPDQYVTLAEQGRRILSNR